MLQKQILNSFQESFARDILTIVFNMELMNEYLLLCKLNWRVTTQCGFVCIA
jgi:hypothetical protein